MTRSEYERQRRRDKQRKVYEYLLDHPCMDCGNADPMVLEFDHRDPKEKLFVVSRGARSNRSWETVEKEINKCDVVCRNCHRFRTAKQLGWYRWLSE